MSADSRLGVAPGALPGRSPATAQSQRPLRAAEPAGRGALIRQAVLLLIVAFLAAPAVTPLAGWVRLTFPAMAALIAGGLILRNRSAVYVTFCLWLFLLTPLVRRIVDSQVGYSQGNVLMLAPYLAVAWAALQTPRFFLTPGRPAQWPMALLFVAILYGFVLALAAGRVFPGTLDLLRWTIPPLLACYLIVRAMDWEAICVELRAWATLALPLVSLYGLHQFVAPPTWDAIWMVYGGMNSIGQPQPFEVRVFSTLNSPASLAYYLNALILITLALKTRWRALNVALGSATLAVTLVRSAWLGLAAGLLLLLARAPVRLRASVLVMGLVGVALVPVALTNPRAEKAVIERIETLTNIGQDWSYTQRTRAYEDATRELVESPWGYGLGIANVAANYTEKPRVVDGGPIEILLSLGVLFGVVYLAVVALLLIAAIMWPAPATHGDLFAAAVAIAVAQALAFSSVTTFIGEIGVLFWLAIGLVLASPKIRPGFSGAEGRIQQGRFHNVDLRFREDASRDAP
jgi:hypothetical protein